MPAWFCVDVMGSRQLRLAAFYSAAGLRDIYLNIGSKYPDKWAWMLKY